MNTTRAQRRQLRRDNLKYGDVLRQIPRTEWPDVFPLRCTEVWRSRDYLVQIYQERDGMERMSVCRTALDGDRWEDGISWDTLQRLKRECGRGDRDAVEIYPADADVINVANMRHLWLMPEPLPFAWRRKC